MRLGSPLVALAVVFLSGCGVGGSAPDQAADLEAERAGTPLAGFVPDGPLHGIIMAAGVGEEGAPLDPTVTFAPGDPEVTAIVALGAAGEDATVTVEWRHIGAGIDDSDALFTHEIPVEPFQRAYSVGVSEGALAAGLYEVTASLGDHDVSTLWRVADAERPFASAAAGGREPRPPQAGGSGALDPPSATASAAGSGECDGLEIYGHDDIVWLVEYGVRANSSHSPGVDCPPAVASGAVSGSAVEIARGPPSFSGYIHPCELPGGSDMPGTVVHLSARYADDKAELSGHQLELVDREEPPIIGFASKPENGARVEAGDTVTLEAAVVKLAPAKGLRWAELRSPDAVLARDEREATPCDWKRFFIVLQTTYTVPDDPPPVIELTAVAEDHDGLEATETIRLFTEERWEGTMRSETKRTYLNPENAGQSCTDAWTSKLAFAVDEAGAVDGKGEATLAAGPACDFPAGHAFTVAKKALFTVEGDADEAGFTLRLGAIRWVPATGASIAGFHELLLTDSGTVDAKAPGPAFRIRKLQPCTAEGDFAVRGTAGPFGDPTVATSTIELGCAEPLG